MGVFEIHNDASDIIHSTVIDCKPLIDIRQVIHCHLGVVFLNNFQANPGIVVKIFALLTDPGPFTGHFGTLVFLFLRSCRNPYVIPSKGLRHFCQHLDTIFYYIVTPPFPKSIQFLKSLAI